MELKHADPDQYANWISRRIGLEIRRRREGVRLSAYALGEAGMVSDQTILNIETAGVFALLSTLARICVRLGITLTELVSSAEAHA